MIFSYIRFGIIYFIINIPLAALIYSIIFLLFRRKEFKNIKRLAVEFISVLYLLAILNITGIKGMTFNLQWFKNSLNFTIPFKGASIMMLVLNLGLFIPVGFLLPIVFNKIRWSKLKIFLTSLAFSFVIEILQMFGGRMSEIDDLIMNSLGALIGYLLLCGVKKVKTA